MSTQVYYTNKRIKKENADFNLIYGEKSNGKSYSLKHEEAILHYLETGKRFILLRRWVADITNLWIEQYFSDVDVARLTNGKYNCISVWKKVVYFAIYDEITGKVKRHEKIGYVLALSTEQHYSGASFLDVDSIIFEEFMERGSYIAHEPDKLMILYSTIDRKRGTTKMWLLGNSISQVCPYFKAWGLDSIFRKLKQGEIATKTIHNEANDVKIAIEYCQASGGKTMAIGNASKMIDKGGWQTTPQPHLPKSYKEYKAIFRFVFQYQGFRFICEYLKDKTEPKSCWFIYPKYTDIREKTIVFSDVVNISKYWQRDIYNPTFKNKKLQKLFVDTFRETNIFYSDDLCGTDFKQVIDFSIRK